MLRGLSLGTLLVPFIIVIISNHDGLFTIERWLDPGDGPFFLASSLHSSQNTLLQLPRYLLGLLSTTEQSQNDDWNILHHLGGNGPWIEKRGGVHYSQSFGPDLDGCVIDQVHMVSIPPYIRIRVILYKVG